MKEVSFWQETVERNQRTLNKLKETRRKEKEKLRAIEEEQKTERNNFIVDMINISREQEKTEQQVNIKTAISTMPEKKYSTLCHTIPRHTTLCVWVVVYCL